MTNRPGIDTVYQENRVLREDIERLRDENKAAWDSAEHNAQRARDAEKRIEELKEQRESMYWDFLAMRGVEKDDVCKACNGLGVRAYPSTSIWRGGIGGQVITNGVCDSCWGSGSNSVIWADLRKLGGKDGEIERLRDEVKRLKVSNVNLITKLKRCRRDHKETSLDRDSAVMKCLEHVHRIEELEDAARTRTERELQGSGKIDNCPDRTVYCDEYEGRGWKVVSDE